MDADGRPHLTDFGLARETDLSVRMTVSGQLLGTPGYMSPEQARGEVPSVDERSDIYGLGATLYFCLTGRAPFAATVLTDVLYAVAHLDPPAVRSPAPAVPRDLETLCHSAMARLREERYASARAFADDLGRFLDGGPIFARPEGQTRRLVRKIRRRPAWALLAAFLALFHGGMALAERLHSSRVDALVREECERGDRTSRETLARQGHLLAGLPRLRACFEERSLHREIGGLLLSEIEHRSMAVELCCVTDGEGRVFAGGRPGLVSSLVSRVLETGDGLDSKVPAEDGRLFRVAASPILDGDRLLGVLVVGREVEGGRPEAARDLVDARAKVRFGMLALVGAVDLAVLLGVVGILWVRRKEARP